MQQQLKIRAACDRCHSQKLRCLKRPSINGCLRCHKAGTGCVFSPSLRSLRSKEPNKLMDLQTDMRAEYSSDNHINGNMDLNDRTGADDPISANEDPRSYGDSTIFTNFPNPDFDNLSIDWTMDPLLMSTPDPTQHENAYRSQPEFGHTSLDPLGNSIPHAASERTDALPSSTLAEDCLLEISRTSDRMYSLYTKLRYEAYKLSKSRSAKQLPTIVSDDSAALLSGYWKSDEPLNDSTLLFEVTQGLNDLYVRFMAIGLYVVREPSYPVGDKAPSNNQDATGSESTSSPIASDTTILSQLPELDHASILLILSCHLRVVDCWNTIVSLSENCERKALARGSVPTTLIVATLKVGSFELPEAQAVSVQWILSVQLVKQLWERSRDLASAVQSSLSTNATDEEVLKVDSTAMLTERMCHDVQARANSSLKELERIRDAFVSRDLT